MTISCGVSTVMALHGGTIRMPEGLLFTADRALYQSKRDGRNRVSTSFLLATTDMVREQGHVTTTSS